MTDSWGGGWTRREFILTAGVSAATALLPSCSRKPKGDLEKKLSDIVRVAPGYRWEELATGLVHPGDVTVNSVDGSVFFTQSNLHRFSKKYDLTDYRVVDKLINENGYSLNVFGLVNGVPALRFEGVPSKSADECEDTHIKINSKSGQEIFIFTGFDIFRSGVLSIYDLKTGGLKARIEDPRSFNPLDTAVNPVDGKLYLCLYEPAPSAHDSFEFSVYYLDTERTSFVRLFDKNDVNQPRFDGDGSLCFDQEGNLYVVVPSHPHRHPDRADTWSNCFEVTKISPNRDIGEFEVDTQVIMPREGNFTRGCTKFDDVSKRLIFGGMCRYNWYRNGIVLAADTVIKERTKEEKRFRTHIERKKFETVAWLEHWLRDGKEVGGAGDIEAYQVNGFDVAKGEYYISAGWNYSGRIFKITPV